MEGIQGVWRPQPDAHRQDSRAFAGFANRDRNRRREGQDRGVPVSPRWPGRRGPRNGRTGANHPVPRSTTFARLTRHAGARRSRQTSVRRNRREKIVTQPEGLLSIGGVVRARVFLFGMILLSAVAARAQMPAPVVSPEVSADRTITLRYRAPDAKQITVTGDLGGKPHTMTKGSDGVWTVTIGPLAPDIYTYVFNVDGVMALDPQNTNTKLGYGNFGPVSVVQVPGDGPQFY